MTIVTNRGPRRKRPKPAQPVKIETPRIVQETPKGRAWKALPLPDDPEADARVAAFMAQMIRPK